jgi:hypothetical protein
MVDAELQRILARQHRRLAHRHLAGKFCWNWIGVRIEWSRRPTLSGDSRSPI